MRDRMGKFMIESRFPSRAVGTSHMHGAYISTNSFAQYYPGSSRTQAGSDLLRLLEAILASSSNPAFIAILLQYAVCLGAFANLVREN